LKDFPKAEKDRVFLSMGRLNYEVGNFDKAITAYGNVERTGPNWMESLEETAWAEFRLGRPEETIAKLKTVINPVFKNESTSEAYFLLSLAQLRVCDFKSVFKTIELFKKNFAETAKQLEATNKTSPQLKEIGETVQKLNLVEAETIQRLYVDENGKKRKGSVAKIEKSSDELSFPETDDDEFWLDEVDSYKVSLKGCLPPASRGKTAKNEVVK
jgi:tetratricopeptide (TPR) repeat protein